VVKSQPSSARAHGGLATVLVDQKRYRYAAIEFKTALQLDPSNDLALQSYIKALTVLGDFTTALPIARAYAERKPANFYALFLLGVCYRGVESTRKR
jgi:tetratricopeptide (TPR) repeat protein